MLPSRVASCPLLKDEALLSSCTRRAIASKQRTSALSLLNVDYKIATRAISGRLLGVIGTVVGYDQTCGIPGCTISENLTLIRDLIEYVDRADMPLALLSLDQEKAFDRVDWGFLQRILVKFGFGDSFRSWISLFLY